MQLHKKRKTDESERYVRLEFNLGFSVQVERAWSAANYVLSGSSTKKKSVLLDRIVLLKYNAQLWSDHLVAEDVKRSISERSKKRFEL